MLSIEKFSISCFVQNNSLFCFERLIELNEEINNIPSDLHIFESSDSKQFIFKQPCELSDLYIVHAAPDLSKIVLFIFFNFFYHEKKDKCHFCSCS